MDCCGHSAPPCSSEHFTGAWCIAAPSRHCTAMPQAHAIPPSIWSSASPATTVGLEEHSGRPPKIRDTDFYAEFQNNSGINGLSKYTHLLWGMKSSILAIFYAAAGINGLSKYTHLLCGMKSSILAIFYAAAGINGLSKYTHLLWGMKSSILAIFYAAARRHLVN